MMNLLATLAALLGLQTEVLMARLKRNAAAYSVIALFGIITLIFLLMALNIALTGYVGSLYAALIIAGAALIIALVILAVLRIGEGSRKRAELERRRNSETTAFATTAAITALPIILKSPLLRTIGIPLAVITAFALLGKSGSDRKSDRDA
jgi:hypothetical protein